MNFYHYYLYSSTYKTGTLQEKFYHINDELLVKFLLNETTREENLAVAEWVKADINNANYLKELQQIWESSREVAHHSKIHEDQAWERFRKRIQKPGIVKEVRKLQWRRIAAVVITLAVLGGGGSWFFAARTDNTQKLVAAEEIVVKDSLPDGSVIVLNKHSSISYPSRFRGSSRQVKLTGEAFFNVAPDARKPFIISVNDVSITVVGTSFNIRTTGARTEVIVETGIVKVKRRGEEIQLRANERLNISPDSSLIKQGVSDKLYNYYRTKEFVCDDTPLWKLVEVLNEAYGSEIIIARNELRNLRLNTTFSNESLDQILNVISLTFNIKIIKEQQRIVLQ